MGSPKRLRNFDCARSSASGTRMRSAVLRPSARSGCRDTERSLCAPRREAADLHHPCRGRAVGDRYGALCAVPLVRPPGHQRLFVPSIVGRGSPTQPAPRVISGDAWQSITSHATGPAVPKAAVVLVVRVDGIRSIAQRGTSVVMGFGTADGIGMPRSRRHSPASSTAKNGIEQPPSKHSRP